MRLRWVWQRRTSTYTDWAVRQGRARRAAGYCSALHLKLPVPSASSFLWYTFLLRYCVSYPFPLLSSPLLSSHLFSYFNSSASPLSLYFLFPVPSTAITCVNSLLISLIFVIEFHSFSPNFSITCCIINHRMPRLVEQFLLTHSSILPLSFSLPHLSFSPSFLLLLCFFSPHNQYHPHFNFSPY